MRAHVSLCQDTRSEQRGREAERGVRPVAQPRRAAPPRTGRGSRRRRPATDQFGHPASPHRGGGRGEPVV